MERDINNQQDCELNELNNQLNQKIKALMKGKSASNIAKKCGVSVSTITRIRNGENKRGINTDLLRKIWKACNNSAIISLEELLTLNGDVSDAYQNKENDQWNQESQELDSLEQQIQQIIINSGVFLRKVQTPYEIIPKVVLYPDMSYEVAFDDGRKKNILFYTKFYSKRRIDRIEKVKKERPEDLIQYGDCFRKILSFEEFRSQHKEYKDSELVIVFNYEDHFKEYAKNLKLLSNTENVTLALMDHSSRRIYQEVCLDNRQQGILTELRLVK